MSASRRPGWYPRWMGNTCSSRAQAGPPAVAQQQRHRRGPSGRRGAQHGKSARLYVDLPRDRIRCRLQHVLPEHVRGQRDASVRGRQRRGSSGGAGRHQWTFGGSLRVRHRRGAARLSSRHSQQRGRLRPDAVRRAVLGWLLCAVTALAAPAEPTYLGPKPTPPVSRVVTMAPSLTELLSLGKGDTLVGVSRAMNGRRWRAFPGWAASRGPERRGGGDAEARARARYPARAGATNKRWRSSRSWACPFSRYRCRRWTCFAPCARWKAPSNT